MISRRFVRVLARPIGIGSTDQPLPADPLRDRGTRDPALTGRDPFPKKTPLTPARRRDQAIPIHLIRAPPAGSVQGDVTT